MSDHKVNGIIHTASFGMSGTSNLPAFHDLVEEVNLGGSRNILQAAVKNNVEAIGKFLPSVGILRDTSKAHRKLRCNITQPVFPFSVFSVFMFLHK